MFKTLLQTPGGPPVAVTLERTAATRVDTHRALLDERTVEVELEQIGEGAGWLRLHERIVPFYTQRDTRGVHVWLAGRTYFIETVARTPQRRAGGGVAVTRDVLTAPMPGTILRLLVTPGAAFEAHAPLVVMESMKMELTLSMPHAGRVEAVTCRVGQLVELGATLLRLEGRP